MSDEEIQIQIYGKHENEIPAHFPCSKHCSSTAELCQATTFDLLKFISWIKKQQSGKVKNLHVESEKGSRMEGSAREEVNIFIKREEKKLPTLHNKHSVKEEDERARWNAATVVYKSACRTARKKKFYKHKR